MNYISSGRSDNEFLLSDERESTKNEHEDTSFKDATKMHAEKAMLLANTDDSHPSNETENKSASMKSYGDYLATDVTDLQDLYTVTPTSQAWVAFDDCENNAQYNRRPKLREPEKLHGSSDESPTCITSNEDKWVKFESEDKSYTTDNGREESVSNTNAQSNCAEDGKLQQFDCIEPQKEVVSVLLDTKELKFDSSISKTLKNVEGITDANLRSTTSGSSHATPVSISVDATDSKVETFEEGIHEPLPAYPQKSFSTTWSMLLRFPDAKRPLRSREWRPVIIKLNGSILQLYHEHESSPFREVSLQCFYDLTRPSLQQQHDHKVHTVKILYVKYKEVNKLMSKKDVHYIAKKTPILKVASHSYTKIQEFIEVVRQAIRSLPIFRDRGICHNTEAVYINVHDTCSAIIDEAGSVVMLGILVRIFMCAFISGNAECELVLNDINVKSKEELRLRNEYMPQRVHKWIKLEECDFHSTVNSNMYNQNRSITLNPLDSCTFEVMQYRVRPAKPLPLLVKCELIMDAQSCVELRAEVKLCDDTKLSKYPRKNVRLYLPIPESWVQLFMKEKLFFGEKSIKSTNSHKAIKMRNRKNRPLTTIETSTGIAKYEPAYKSIVWRIPSLPLLNTTAPADCTHDFLCCIQTSDSVPHDYNPTCAMEYEIPYTVASDTNVVNFKVLDKKIALKEVTYHTTYSYEIMMKTTYLNDSINHHK
ncbi:stonin-2-like [Xenia sp. Carnegie-2017]|uniref:stonin-2-like n=1 Tax=Xenia sp. Carnegie-2017 TaxID=2897299 RepID=UPI001F04FCA5|nr:stonin-2-like [Xenia sp. Carnegie-2017]